MRPFRRLVAVSVAFAALTIVGGAVPVGAAGPQAKVLSDGLSSPKGLDVTDTSEPVVAQGAFGAPGPVLVFVQRGQGRGTTVEVSESLNLVDVAVSPLDGTGWGLGGDAVLYHQLSDGTVVPVLDIPAYQATDPDPVDQEGLPTDSNPYGLTVMANGDALVADAAGNDLIRVTPEGDATTVARFDVEDIATDHLPPDFPLPPGVELPPELTAEAVPTSVTVGPDGAIYVGELKGFPFRPGSSHVWRIAADAEDAWCSVNDPEPSCTVYEADLTSIQDIAFNPNNGRLYVYELAADGALAFEAGFETGVFPPAVLLEVKANKRTEIAVGQLSQPGGVAVAPNGHVFVTDQVFTGGRLLRVVG